MQITDINQLDTPYDHIYLSSHLDDVALSCGGAIAKQIQAGERVLVVTICTASPPADAHFSDFAQQLHADWQLAPEAVVRARLAEDRQAMDVLGADYYWADMLDCIYRHPTAYDVPERIISTNMAADDPLLTDLVVLLRRLHSCLPQAQVHAPLAIGPHIDHWITHQAAATSIVRGLVFYEDFPYVLTADHLDKRLAGFSDRLKPLNVSIDTTIERRISACAAYVSQIPWIFGGVPQMAEQMRAYAASVGSPDGMYGERSWVERDEQPV